MERVALMYGEHAVGELTAEQSGLYVCFRAAGRLPDDGLWCAWAEGTEGRLRLGVLEPRDGEASIRRRISGREAAGLGRLTGGVLRPAGERARQRWEAARSPETLVSDPWLRRALGEQRDVLTRQEAGRRYLALPWQCGEPFPLPPLFCLASVREVEGRTRAVFCFADGQPCFPQEEA